MIMSLLLARLHIGNWQYKGLQEAFTVTLIVIDIDIQRLMGLN